MRRIATWLLSTVTVVVLMFGYHTSTSSTLTVASPPAFVGSSSTGESPSTAGPSNTTTLTGDVAQTQWGPVQVAVKVNAGTLTDVAVLQYPHGSSEDEEINSYALPMLIQQTLDKQSADIDMVSGATVTSGGYQQSLQSALDQAGL